MTEIIAQVPSLSLSAFQEAGLTDETLRQVILQGEALRDSATINDPPGRGGYDAWAECVRALRDRLVPLGWTRDDSRNFSVVVTPCGQHAIAVSSGNAKTGIEGKEQPTTKRPKGEATVFAVRSNQLQLFSEPIFQAQPRLTWFLLIWASPDRRIVRAELSLPESMSETGVIYEWSKRYILEPIEIEGEMDVMDSDDEAADIDVEVTRKQ